MNNYSVFLKELFKRGIITKETYEQAKNKENEK